MSDNDFQGISGLEGSITERVMPLGAHFMSAYSLERRAQLSEGNERIRLLLAAKQDYNEILAIEEAKRWDKEYAESRIKEIREPYSCIPAPPGFDRDLPEPQWEKLFYPIPWLKSIARKSCKALIHTFPVTAGRSWKWHELYKDPSEEDVRRRLKYRECIPHTHSGRTPPSPKNNYVTQFIGDFVRHSDEDLKTIRKLSIYTKFKHASNHIEELIRPFGFKREMPIPTFWRDLEQYYKTHRMYNAKIDKLLDELDVSIKDREILDEINKVLRINSVKKLVRFDSVDLLVDWACENTAKITKKDARKALKPVEDKLFEHGLSFYFQTWEV